MLKYGFIRILATTLLIVTAAFALNAAPTWEKVANRHTEMAEPSEAVAFDVKVYDGTVYLTLASKMPVKVITILGQPVAQQELEAGTWSLPLSARGIYILKIGSATRRITI